MFDLKRQSLKGRLPRFRRLLSSFASNKASAEAPSSGSRCSWARTASIFNKRSKDDYDSEDIPEELILFRGAGPLGHKLTRCPPRDAVQTDGFARADLFHGGKGLENSSAADSCLDYSTMLNREARHGVGSMYPSTWNRDKAHEHYEAHLDADQFMALGLVSGSLSAAADGGSDQMVVIQRAQLSAMLGCRLDFRTQSGAAEVIADEAATNNGEVSGVSSHPLNSINAVLTKHIEEKDASADLLDVSSGSVADDDANDEKPGPRRKGRFWSFSNLFAAKSVPLLEHQTENLDPLDQLRDGLQDTFDEGGQSGVAYDPNGPRQSARRNPLTHGTSHARSPLADVNLNAFSIRELQNRIEEHHEFETFIKRVAAREDSAAVIPGTQLFDAPAATSTGKGKGRASQAEINALEQPVLARKAEQVANDARLAEALNILQEKQKRERQDATAGPSRTSPSKSKNKPKPAPEDESETYSEAPEALTDIPCTPTTRTCLACADELPRSSFPPMPVASSCTHQPSICTDCTESWLALLLENSGPKDLHCPECPAVLQHHEVQRAASPDTFDWYDTLIARAAASEDPNFAYCRTAGCENGQFRDSEEGVGGYMRCADCGTEQCTSHGAPWHAGETCKQFEARDGGEDSRAKREEAASEKVVGKISKKCPGPGCGIRIEKAEGCDQ